MSYEVPPDADAAVCPYCGAPFRDEERRALHLGLEHGEALEDDERAAFEAAYEAESAALRRFRLKALGALVALYFGLLMTYAVVT